MSTFFQGIIVDQLLLFTQSQLFGNAPFWNSCVLVVTHCVIYFEQTSGNVPSKLKQTPTWMTWTKQQSSILYSDIYSSSKHRPPPLSGTQWYPVICVWILTVSTSHWSIIFVENKGHILKNFFLFLLIPSFSLSNLFRTKTIGCHYVCSIIFPSHYSSFLTLIGQPEVQPHTLYSSSELLSSLKWELLSSDLLSKCL